MSSDSWIVPDWNTPRNVRTLITTRCGGVSQGEYTSLNLGDHVGDEADSVSANRQRVCTQINALPRWLEQVHGTVVIDAAVHLPRADALPPRADASFVRRPGIACAVMTADCLPVLFCDDAGRVVAAAHAGWRGLLDGVLEQAVSAMGVAGDQVLAYLGPAIGPQAFEVGDEVRDAFIERDARAAGCFQALSGGKWLADLYGLARQRLAGKGVFKVHGGEFCTFNEPDRFFSYRRDGKTGRMASMIWLV